MKLRELLAEATDEEVDESFDTSRVLSNAQFELEYQISYGHFLIIQLKVYIKRQGLGTRVVDTIRAYCQTHDLIPVVTMVRNTAEATEFWEAMGFQPATDGSEQWVHTQYLENA